MSIYTAPFKDPNYILLNQRESNAISPRRDKQQGLSKLSDGFCNICSRPTHYRNQELCYKCRNHLIRGTLFPELGELVVTPEDNHIQYKNLVTDKLVEQIDRVMNGKFKTRTYKNKLCKMICVYHKFLALEGEIEVDVCYRRLRYYANTMNRSSLQQALQEGKKIYRIFNSI
ncbi:hypothetical protein N9X61_01150 [Sulfurimonas sp.]|nr:hypothetical protein [Sulfurimonas sp.]